MLNAIGLTVLAIIATVIWWKCSKALDGPGEYGLAFLMPTLIAFVGMVLFGAWAGLNWWFVFFS
jgi:hypothetical protein